jgi:hypothetical protein
MTKLLHPRRRTLRALWQRAGGNVTVELAMAVPILAMLLVGVIDVAMGFQAKLRLESAARAGAQYAITLGATEDTAGITQAARDDAADPVLDVVPQYVCRCLNGTTIPCTANCAGGEVPLKYAVVTVNGNYTPLFNYPGLPAAMALTADAQIRVR